MQIVQGGDSIGVVKAYLTTAEFHQLLSFLPGLSAMKYCAMKSLFLF
jgi:hypothetical protein